MSTDTISGGPTSIRSDRRTTGQLLAAAQRDADAVSVFMNGSELVDIESAILVVKGREHIDYLLAMLKRQGLLTDGKAVEPRHG